MECVASKPARRRLAALQRVMPIGSPATRTGRQYPEPANLRKKS